MLFQLGSNTCAIVWLWLECKDRRKAGNVKTFIKGRERFSYLPFNVSTNIKKTGCRQIGLQCKWLPWCPCRWFYQREKAERRGKRAKETEWIKGNFGFLTFPADGCYLANKTTLNKGSFTEGNLRWNREKQNSRTPVCRIDTSEISIKVSWYSPSRRSRQKMPGLCPCRWRRCTPQWSG